jgi:hypothetical protein
MLALDKIRQPPTRERIAGARLALLALSPRLG